ncbi:MAG TPA: hypothetical protein VHB98_22945 [Chloroflexota bacterium]|jgi:hypothetical protein|nr:hypothetical protein [Chloroflexota bacterium]
MMWLDEVREELRRQQVLADPFRDGLRSTQTMAATDEAVARADALVRTLLDQMNQALLGGRGSVRDAHATWGLHLWELWWEPARSHGPYLVVTLLRDSRGTAYLRVQGRRLALEDTRLKRRLQRALRAAFLEPRMYAPRTDAQTGTQELLQPTATGGAPAGNGRSIPLSEAPRAAAGAQDGGPVGDMQGTMRTRHNGRDDS